MDNASRSAVIDAPVKEEKTVETSEEILYKKINTKTAVIGVIGMGYVGLPLIMEFAQKDFVSLGFDIDNSKISKLKNGKSYIKYIPTETIKDLINKRYLVPENDFSKLSTCDCIIICVPTPCKENMDPDLSFIVKSTEMIARHLRKGQLVILESTTYPGTTREICLPALEKNGLKEGTDFFLAFSPERVDPGNTKYSFSDVTKVVGGISDTSASLAETLYGKVTQNIKKVSTAEIAETTKMLENTFRAVNIALVNELKIMLEKMNINIWEVIEASSTKPYGFMPFFPGPGWGGHCIPIDPFYLAWKAKQYNFDAKFIKLAGEINTTMPYYVISKAEEGLRKSGKKLKDSLVLIIGAAYKSDVDDIRESPSIQLIEILNKKGARVIYNDPYIPRISGMRQHRLDMESIELTPETIQSADCVIIATAHSSYDYKMIFELSKLIVDTRNAFKGFRPDSKLIRA